MGHLGRGWVWAAAALGLWACGDEKPPVAQNRPGNGGLDASVDGQASLDASGDGGPKGPVVSLVAPFTRDSIEAFDVDDDELVVAGRLDVRCDFQSNPQTGVELNPSSTKASVTYAGANGPDPIVKAAARELDDTFLATFDLDKWPSGPIEVRCLADDVGEPPKTGDAVGYTYLDRGPAITVHTPAANSAFAGEDEWIAEIEVRGQPLTDDDTAGAMVSATFFVNGIELPGGKVSRDGNIYSFLLDFDDTTYFTPGLTSASVQVQARNGRMPEPALTELHLPLIVDDLGPNITFVNPKDEDIEAGEATVRVRIDDDAAGVDPDSVRLRIASGEPIQMTQEGADIYTHTFATRGYDPAPFITLEVTANDSAANDSAADILVYLDNVKPWISMDPPTMRVYRKNGSNPDDCSPEFDPLGGFIYGADSNTSAGAYYAAANDLDTVIENVMLRAFVYDRTNTAPGASSVVYSNTDNSTVELWLQRNPSVPLLIDTNGDGVCDDINTDPGATQDTPDSFDLEPLALTPSNNMPKFNSQTFDGNDPYFDATLGPPPYSGCTTADNDNFKEPTEGACTHSPRFVIKHAGISSPTRVIFAYNPNDPAGDVNCRGASVPLQIGDPEFNDWVCLATRAYDKAGNRGISAPLRLCVDGDGTDKYSATCETVQPAPSCLGGCTLETFGSNYDDGGPKDIPSGVGRTVVY